MDNPRQGLVEGGAAELLGAGGTVGAADAESDGCRADWLGAAVCGWGGGADEQAARFKQLTAIATVIAFANRVMVRATVAVSGTCPHCSGWSMPQRHVRRTSSGR